MRLRQSCWFLINMAASCLGGHSVMLLLVSAEGGMYTDELKGIQVQLDPLISRL